ncbi:MAG: CPBP family intramembrane metalloprotease [Planctomycetota bacterium]|nr:CPBP family intramembrane metalloprotease [Planctomycetota bacterium]
MTDDAAPPASPLLRIAGWFYALVTLFAFGYAVFDGLVRSGPREASDAFLGLALPSLGLAFAGLGVGLVLVGVVHVGMRAVPGVDRAAREFATMLGPIQPREAIWLAVFSAVGEELLFRGALWTHLGLVGTSLLFGLVHVMPRRALWGYPIFAAAAGLLMGLLRDASGSVFPPILAHFAINALNLWWLSKNHARLVGAAPRVDV